jgi:circadian clock protein KaiC
MTTLPRTNPRCLSSTGVPGLDEILGGGLRTGSLYLVYGPAGAGKTVLASQIGIHLARHGHDILVVTLIAESHGKLLDHLSGFAFFDEALVGEKVFFISGYEALQRERAEGLLRLVSALACKHRPRLLVLEGLWMLRALGLSDFEVAQFVHQLNSLMTTLYCTAMLLDPGMHNPSSPEQALVDATIELTSLTQDGRLLRQLQVHKHRAADPILGQHIVLLNGDGLRVFPRMEAATPRRLVAAREQRERASFGVEHLDEMLGGGLMRGATTLLLGTPGAGKTLLGLKFLEHGLAQGERALYFGFYESPERLLGKAEGIGLQLRGPIDRGELQLRWQPALEFGLDELGYALLDAVQEGKPQRVLIDGLDGFMQSAMRKDRLSIFLTALTTELRGLGVDTLITQEAQLSSPSEPSDAYLVSALVENIILLRYVERGARLHRLLSLVKVRESGYDSSIREFRISSDGLDVSASFASAQSVLTAGDPG